MGSCWCNWLVPALGSETEMRKNCKANWFETLNDALESELLTELWPLGSNIGYGETVQHIVEDGRDLRLISVYRNENGMYERVITYVTGINPFPQPLIDHNSYLGK